MAVPVVISKNGYGTPVRAVDKDAPEMVVAENGIGTPITITDLGTPFIVRGLFTPLALFANGEQGAWFDPSDLGSMFQDAAGTIPAAYGQPVGLILDRSGNGNHASQATATARPTLGRMPAGGVRNLLTHTENLADPAWFKRDAVATAGSAAAPDGTMTAARVVAQAGPYADRTRGSVLQESVGADRTFSLFVKSAGAPFARIYVSMNFGTGLVVGVNLTTGAVAEFGHSSFGTSSVTVTALPDGWFEVALVNRNSSYPSGNYGYGVTGALAAPIDYGAPADGSLDTSGGVYVWHPQVEAGEVATPYQRVGASRYDVTEDGVQSLTYLQFDGVDDSLVAPPESSPLGSTPSYLSLIARYESASFTSNAGLATAGSGVLKSSRAIGVDVTGMIKVDMGGSGNSAPMVLPVPAETAVWEAKFGQAVEAALNGEAFVSTPAVADTAAGGLILGQGITGIYRQFRLFGAVHLISTLAEKDRAGWVRWGKQKGGIQ